MNAENIKKKCFPCFRKKECLLLPFQQGECLGPFTDVKDQLKKFQTYYEENLSKAKADLEKAKWEVELRDYLRNKKLFDKSEDR